jgi:mannose-6-phosphate isomerase-like protein (cupin superfamily)
MLVVHDLSADAVARMARVNLAELTEQPPSPIGHFDFHGCLCGVASFVGSPPWELHTTGDELLHVLAGESRLVVRNAEGESMRVLRAGDLAIVPRGCWHRNDAADGVTMLFMTPKNGNSHSWDDPTPR